jgi:A/G-specific adenine glycosylase
LVLLKYYQRSGRDLPWRRTQDPYKVLIAELLLQKTAAGPAQKVWEDVIRLYPTVESLAVASPDDLQKIIGILGLNKRSKYLINAASIIARQSHGELRAEANFLESLPGVGKYTASAILSFAFGLKSAAIDVNAARVYGRIAGFSPVTLRQALAFALVIGQRLVTQKSHREVNYAVLDLAAQICRPKPLCDICPALRFCDYTRTTSINR